MIQTLAHSSAADMMLTMSILSDQEVMHDVDKKG
jgi:hypothetical protein